jgi:hypothetical protein
MAKDSTSKNFSGHMSPDLIAWLMFPAFILITIFVGPERAWIVLLLIALLEITTGIYLLRRKHFGLSAWLALLMGVIAFGYVVHMLDGR